MLLLGETGTGKVAAIPDTLLEVEFFDAAPGASASSNSPTAVRSFSTKSATCRCRFRASCCVCCKDKEFEPLGSNRIMRADVRIIAATSADLPALVAAGRFRADLLYCLNVLTIHAPPLRARLSDIEALAYAIRVCYSRGTGR